jgi:hypothetical protein
MKTKIRVKNGKWEINGKTLTEYKGDQNVMAELLMKVFKIDSIQTPVNENSFKQEIEPNQWKEFSDVVSTVNNTWLKEQNHKFKNSRGVRKSINVTPMEEYPNISRMSFVRAIGVE